MRGSEMLTAQRGAGTPPSTLSSPATAAAADLAGAGALSVGGGGNFPLAVALLAFGLANFINILSI